VKIAKQAKRQAKQLFRYCLVNGSLDENRVRSVMQHVVSASRRDSAAVLSHLKRLVKLDLARRTASVDSAAPLPPDLRADIEAGLTRRYGSGLTTAFAQRPELIGGMRIQVGSDVYDSSVRAALAALEKGF
jgi:F-type H+-transporting ATPase subunit delta